LGIDHAHDDYDNSRSRSVRRLHRHMV
jgi:hypothetical protein